MKTIFNDVLRLLSNSKREQHISIKAMLDKIGWMSINQLACQTRLVETWKALHLENYCLNDVFERVESGTIRTRSSNKIKLKSHFKTRIRETSFQLPSVHLWNSAPTEITEATSESRARAEVQKYVMQNIPI